MSNLLALDLNAAVVFGELLNGFEYLVVVGHFCLGAYLFYSAAMAVAEGVDTVQGLYVEIIWNGDFDDGVAVGCICVD